MKKQSLKNFIVGLICLIALIFIAIPGIAATSKTASKTTATTKKTAVVKKKSNAVNQSVATSYYSLKSWCTKNKMTSRWVTPYKKIRLSKNDITIDLNIGERSIKFNGTTIWICDPVKYQNGQPYVSKRDAEITLGMLVAPEHRSRKVRTVMLDPGHGGKQPGAMVAGKREKDYTLLIAKEVRRILVDKGLKVVLTREGDTTLGLYERADLAKRANADLLVSIHLNAASSKTANGLEIFTTTPAGAQSTNPDRSGSREAVNGNANDKYNLLLAYEIQRKMLATTKMADRGVRRDRLAILNRATMPATLVEVGFVTNPSDQKKIFTKSERDKAAKAIAEGILLYKEKVDPR